MKNVSEKNLKLSKLSHFRFRQLNGKYLITNDYGHFELLEENLFNDLLEGKIPKKGELYARLCEKGFIAGKEDKEKLARKFLNRNNFLKSDPGLHIVVVTLRCNFKCLYCQTSAREQSEENLDMSPETAEKVVDMIFQSRNDAVTLEFQGGEPLLNWNVVKFIIEYSLEKMESTGKSLYLSLVTNGSLLDEEKLAYLIEKKVSICVSLDGPEEVHDFNRGRNHAKVSKNVERAVREYKTYYPMHMPGALTTITRKSLGFGKEIVDEYIKYGFEGIHLRPFNTIGVARDHIGSLGYTVDEFMDFYRKTMEYILEINRGGRFFLEKSAQVFLMKILTDTDPGFVDIMSPCGAGSGQVAYNYDGDVYTCDEARMLALGGDKSFRIGNVHTDTLAEALSHRTVKVLCIASCLDGIPMCADCAYKPYCGVCPVMNYIYEGNIFSRIPENFKHRLFSMQLDYLFEKMQEPEAMEVFRKWMLNPNERS